MGQKHSGAHCKYGLEKMMFQISGISVLSGKTEMADKEASRHL